MAQGRHWLFTLNNYTDDEVMALNGLYPERISYIVFGYEEAPDTATPHLQGYLSFHKGKKPKLSAMKKINSRAHWTIARGTPQQNRDYCTKDGKFEEQGELPMTQQQQQKEKWERAWDLAKQGRFEEMDPSIRFNHIKTAEHIYKKYGDAPEVESLPATCGIWIYGPPNTGKSYSVRDAYPHREIYSKRKNKWWDGYRDQSVVLLDDLDYNHAYLSSEIKLWADVYPFPAEYKGGSHGDIRPKLIIVTSNYLPSQIWQGDMNVAIERRFIIMRKMTRESDISLPALQPVSAPLTFKGVGAAQSPQ